MPEGPELALSRDQLRPVLLGKQIINVFTSDKGRYRAKDPPGYGRFLEHLVDGVVFTIAEINVKGKLMWWRLTSPRLDKDWYVWITYGMSGQWVLDGSEPAQHVSCTFFWNDSGNKFDPYQVPRVIEPQHLVPCTSSMTSSSIGESWPHSVRTCSMRHPLTRSSSISCAKSPIVRWSER